MGFAVEELRLAVYRGFVDTGRAPNVGELATGLDIEPEQVRHGLRQLHAHRHLVLDGGGRVVLAHPFSSIPLGFAVMGSRALWWGGCAWDSFALAHLLPDEPEILVSTRCPCCAAPHAWNVSRDRPPMGNQVAHFLVPVAQMWDDVVHTCAHQRLFCNAACVRNWLARSDNSRGYVMGLPTLWRLAAHWYDGRLDPGYTRRDPAAAAAYFRATGLTGPFWGL